MQCLAAGGRGLALLPAVPPVDPETLLWFAETLQPHEAMLRAWLRSRFPQLLDLDDIIQESYGRVLHSARLREQRSPKAFFFATARNLAYDQCRRRQVALLEPLADEAELALLDESADIGRTVAKNEQLELMTAAIQHLPDRCRQVLTLRYVYGLSHRDISAQLGITLATVESQITAGIKRCVQYVAQKE